MPRRKRTVKRREADPLAAMAALAAANAFGCDGVPDDLDLDDIYAVWERANSRPGTWSTLTFEDGDPAPCERMDAGTDPFTGNRIPPPGCGTERCLFARERAA